MEKQPEPVRKKPRRYTAESQQVSEAKLVGVFELPHGAGRPDPQTPASKDASKDAEKPGATRNKAEPIFSEQAAEDDPRRWGDNVDDLGEWMKSQRPPHWD